MYYAKHHRKKAKKQFIVLISSLALLLAFAVGTTIAYLVTNTSEKVNTFRPSKVACEVVEQFDNNVKNDVKIQNTGDTEAYIRATVVVTWVKDDGTTSAEKPIEGTDYAIKFTGATNDWLKGENTGFWYYTKPVAPNALTGQLFTECKQIIEKNGYHLSVEIVASAIQSTPQTVVEDKWNVTVDDASGYVTAVPGTQTAEQGAE